MLDPIQNFCRKSYPGVYLYIVYGGMRYNLSIGYFWDILIFLLVVYVENIPSCAAISSQGFESQKNLITQ